MKMWEGDTKLKCQNDGSTINDETKEIVPDQVFPPFSRHDYCVKI